ncbi:Scr1 family TA system antitoxin-like transcriptional regulator [Wenjunlia vitaminophila]|uniref:Scr1 family TA system antitoxin-like transcriptional regulator n=1 Tax=Wenjunlia vitaminophila TaxID=76728 RepID=UPI001F372D1B|nr:Scr1 family TA system antitoxin-like transcriptional regulator [Wenjunlia vitaminophila]
MTGDRTRGWWEEYQDLLQAGLLELTELEHHATAVRTSQLVNVPGLLQAPDHARSVFFHLPATESTTSVVQSASWTPCNWTPLTAVN